MWWTLIFKIILLAHVRLGARGGAVGCGTVPQAGRSRVRFSMMSLYISCTRRQTHPWPHQCTYYSYVTALVLSPGSNGNPEAATAVVAPDDGREDAQNMLSCI